MLVGGMSVVAGRVLVTAGAGTTPTYFNQGVGFLSGDRIAIDTGAPAGNTYDGGIRQSAAGALYGTTSLDSSGPDQYIAGLRVSQLGQLVYADAAPTQVCNGNPLTATGAFAVNTA